MFHKAARKKHIVKLDTLIEACDIMLTESENEMNTFKVFLVGSHKMQDNQKNIDGEANTKRINAEVDKWYADGMAKRALMMNMVSYRSG